MNILKHVPYFEYNAEYRKQRSRFVFSTNQTAGLRIWFPLQVFVFLCFVKQHVDSMTFACNSPVLQGILPNMYKQDL